ncbi:MAG TPA: beta-propeller fold lactonase family protein [Terriglobales bacterium]|nr:beta-propeller fold lactonase family protein [Terriglobales bacterium]
MSYIRFTAKCTFAMLFLVGTIFASTSPTITVASPIAGTVGNPTYFDATASTSSCAAGISAVRIYTAPGVIAFTTNSPHLETFLKLKPTTYNVVIQAWDNCGGVAKFPIKIAVSGAAGVHIFLPTSTSSTTPVHVAASAENSACAGGISALRIYPSSGVNAFTSSGATLDAFINLLPGTYSAIAQAWDTCGHVFKTPFTISSTGGAFGKFLYIAQNDDDSIAEFQLSAGTLINSNGSNNPPPQFSVPAAPNTFAVDPPGNIAYAGLSDGRISIFDINRANGRLFSKGTVSAPGTGPASVTVDRSGNFLFVAEEGSNDVSSYSINRSSGALTFIGTVPAASKPIAIITDWSGHFVYVSNNSSDNVSGYAINTMNGKLTPVPGSPYLASSQPLSIGATAKVVYTLNGGDGTASGYNINGTSGSLTPAPGSPFQMSECCGTPNMMDLDPIHNLLLFSAIGFTFGTDNIQTTTIQSNGSLYGGSAIGGVYGPTSVALDPSYQFVYTCEVDGYTGQPQVISIKYAPNGTGSIFSGPLARPAANPIQIAVSR